MERALAIALSLAACGGASPRLSTPAAAASTALESIPSSAWRRVTLDPTTLSMELPGEPALERTSAPWGASTSLSVVARADVAGARFEIGAHDLAARELSTEDLQTFLHSALVDLGATSWRTNVVSAQGGAAVDGLADLPGARVLMVRVIAGRTRAYHPMVVAPRAVAEHLQAEIARFLDSMAFEPDDVRWQSGDGAWTDDAPWSWVHPPGLGFTVEVPGAPVLRSIESSWPEGVSSELYVASSDERRVFRVRLTHFGGRPPPRNAIDAILRRARILGSTVSEPAPITLRGAGGREWIVTTASSRTLVRAVVAATAIFEVSATVPTDSSEAMAVESARFVRSLYLDGRCFGNL